MIKAIAFFPWASLNEAVTIGPIRLIPYLRKNGPRNLPHASLSDIDDILGAYSSTHRRKIREAVLLEYGDWAAGTDPNDVVDQLFRVRNLLSFAALSERRLFAGHDRYVNHDAFTLVVQNFIPGSASSFAYWTRRRDGGANYYWSSDSFAFHRPRHVPANVTLDVSPALVNALLQLGPRDANLYEALVEFNSANTDSSNVPPHVEIVMHKSAFEWLFAIDHRAVSFEKAVLSALHDIPVASSGGPLKGAWEKRTKGGGRPIAAWAREFCDIRGEAAHGKQRKPDRFIWSTHAHLAFSSILFPLLFKKKLADDNRIELSETDVETLKRIDSFLMVDPFKLDDDDDRRQHPWREIAMEARMSGFARRLYPNMQAEINAL